MVTNTIMQKARHSFSTMVMIVGCALSSIVAQTITYYQTGEEFNGPFPSWKNVKTDYGAKGDGTTDDAAAINAAFTALQKTQTGTFSVLYFPAGTYKIGSKVTFLARVAGDEYSGSGVIGEDPATTLITWAGSSGGTMMGIDAWNNKVSRLSFDGKGVANFGIAREGGFGTGTEISDCYFRNFASSGLVLATGQNGQAEHLIIRCRFSQCKDVAIMCPNMNSLDEWIWYCVFEDCGSAVDPGGFQMYGNAILRMTNFAVGLSWQPAAMVNNTIVNSTNLVKTNAYGNYYFQGNKIYNTPAFATFDNFVFLNNTIATPAGTAGAITITTDDNHSFGLLCAGNTYNATDMIKTRNAQQDGATKRWMGDNVKVDASTLPVPTTIELPAAPPKVTRKIFEVTSADNIQTQIVAACSEPAGSRPVVHIPKGKYTVRATISVPGNKDISIVGDGSGGFGTFVSAALTAGSPTIKLLSPSRVTIQDIDFNGNPGIQVEVSDQKGSRVLGRLFNAQGVDAARRASQALVVDSIDHADLLFSGAGIQRCNAAVMVRGGKDAATADGQIAFLSGASSHALSLWNVQNNGRLIGQGFWKEADISVPGKHLLDLAPTSSGSIALGAMFWCDNMDTLSLINGFKGVYSILGSKFQRFNMPAQTHRIVGDGSNSNIIFGCVADFAGTPNFIDNSSPDASAGMIGTSMRWKKASGVPDSASVRTNLSLMRSLRIDKPVACPDGVTDVKLLRVVATSDAGLAARFVGKPAGPQAVLDPKNFGWSNTQNRGAFQQIASFGATIRIPSEAKRIVVYNMQGRMVWNKTITNQSDIQLATKSIETIRKQGIVVVRIFR